MNQNPHQRFDWGSLFIAILKRGLFGIAGGYIIVGIKDYNISIEESLNTNAILGTVI